MNENPSRDVMAQALQFAMSPWMDPKDADFWRNAAHAVLSKLAELDANGIQP